MGQRQIKVWCNAKFPEVAEELLRKGLEGHELVMAPGAQASNLTAGQGDEGLAGCEVGFGQPAPGAVVTYNNIKWIHLTSAGYERYDTAGFRQGLSQQGTILSTSSSVYAEPCAEHALAMMLGISRRLPEAVAEQRGARGWPQGELRARSEVLAGQVVLMLGFGAIGRRLAELLRPFGMRVMAVRRSAGGMEGVEVYDQGEVERLLGLADHVVNLLPGGEGTRAFMSAGRIGRMKQSAVLYNIGRGTTVDQGALAEALQNGRIAGAYLDVMDPEPLPAEHALWTAPNCYLTPHTAGGQRREFVRLVEHFLDNLRLYERGEGLRDRVM